MNLRFWIPVPACTRWLSRLRPAPISTFKNKRCAPPAPASLAPFKCFIWGTLARSRRQPASQPRNVNIRWRTNEYLGLALNIGVSALCRTTAKFSWLLIERCSSNLIADLGQLLLWVAYEGSSSPTRRDSSKLDCNETGPSEKSLFEVLASSNLAASSGLPISRPFVPSFSLSQLNSLERSREGASSTEFCSSTLLS